MVVDYTDARDAGWHFFPIYPMAFKQERWVCTCDLGTECKTPGKHPRLGNWQYTPIWDDDQMSNYEDDEGIFYGNQFENGYGIVTNTSGLLVVDVDGRNGGWESAKKLAHVREQCKFIVKTGSGNGEHWYFKNEGAESLRYQVNEYPGIEFKSTGYVVGCCSMHASGDRYYALQGTPADVCQAPTELIELLKRPERSESTSGEEVNLDELPGLIDAIPNAALDYDRWISIGMALHDATQGGNDGLVLWIKWSAKNAAHDDRQMDMKWHSFGRNPSKITVGTLYSFAQESGYERPVTFIDDTQWDDDQPKAEEQSAAQSAEEELPHPPGLVGDVTDWINRRSIFPRKNLAIAAALQIVSNAASMRYRVAPLKTTLNLLILGTAGSRTGKNEITNCIKEAHRAIGISQTLHGNFKSTKELIKNAADHQCLHYLVEEMGGFFSKVGNASKSGATYIEDLLETFMQMFTEGNSFHLVTGDMKREMIQQADEALMRINKLIDDGKTTTDDPRFTDAQRKRKSVEIGIESPCLSMFGMGEPFKFEAAILKDPWLLVGGFLGRALIFDEPETVPMKKDFSEISNEEIPMHIRMQLNALFWDGHTIQDRERIELKGEIHTIHMTDEALVLLRQIELFWRQTAIKERDDGSNLESQALGATEIVIKVAGVLGAANKRITKNDLVWAQTLVRKITLAKIAKAKSGDKMTSGDSKERGSGLLIGIMATLRAVDDGLTIGRIRNKVSRKTSTEVMQQGVDALIQAGRIRMEQRTGSNSKVSTIYFAVR